MSLKTKVDLDKELLTKYSVSIPRYTSYPTAPEWTENFIQEDFLKANKTANKLQSPISLYFHLPFCESQCYFCACNVVISKRRDVVIPYLEHIKKEIRNLGTLTDKKRNVEQIHLGGGTPTYFTPYELKDFFSSVQENYNILRNCEVGIEIDPRVTTTEHLKVLSELGFNRLSMGIQDFEPKVQEAVNRIQPYEETKKIFNLTRELGFNSVNVDLIYGLPHQTVSTFSKTIDLILKLNPDRIALFHYAHLPQLINHQEKYISTESLPNSDVKIEIFKYAVQTLTDSGYSFIGLDHFAKPNDELAKSKDSKTLHRNFQGYTTKANCDLYGFGITAISNIQDTFSQNIKKLNRYYEAISTNKLPLSRGITLNKDDLLRKEIIMKILCHGLITKSDIEEKYQIRFNKYFPTEIEKLKILKKDGLVNLNENTIEVTNIGQFFLRNIACTFDFYLQQKNGKQKIYSKTI